MGQAINYKGIIMSIFVSLLVLLSIGLGLAMLIPLLTLGAIFIAMFACFLIWVLPILIIANSDKVSGGEKLAWILAIIFLSWFACVFYFLLAPLKREANRSEYTQQRYYT